MSPETETPGGASPDPLQSALLRLAICCGDREAVRRRLDAGADPNARDAAGQTPLMLAASLGQARMCEMLRERGAEAAPESRGGPVEAAPAMTAEAFPDRAYRIAKALLAANAADPQTA